MNGSKTFSDSIASGASTSAGITLGGANYGRIVVQVGTMSTAAAIGLQHTMDNSSYYNVFHQTINSATVATPQVFIASGVGTNGGVTVLPVAGLQQIRFVASAVVSGGVQFKVICSD